MSKPLLILGNKNYSSWSLRPFMALGHTDIEFDDMVLPLDTPEFAARISDYNPTGKVPVLIVGDLRIWDSLAILEYVAEERPHLWPKDRSVRAKARAIAAEMHSGFPALRAECPMNIRATDRKVEIGHDVRRDIDRIETIWTEALSASGGPYLFGQFSCADAMYAPVASRFRTYNISLSETAAKYVEVIHQDPAFLRWQSAALKETWKVDADEAG